IASMFMASAAVAAEKMGDEKKAAADEKKADAKGKGEDKKVAAKDKAKGDTKKAEAKEKGKGDTKKMAAKDTAKGENQTKGESKKSDTKEGFHRLTEESGPPRFPLPLKTSFAFSHAVKYSISFLIVSETGSEVASLIKWGS